MADPFARYFKTARTAQAPAASQAQEAPPPDDESAPKKLPKGVVLGKDGKPCRSCTSFAAWAAMAKQTTSPSTTSNPAPTAAPSGPPATAPSGPPPDCPPDVDVLGAHTWTLLHTLTATYPRTPSPPQQCEMSTFLALFARLYPCSVCADDFAAWMGRPENAPRLASRADFGAWMCEAHNAVNRKLGKREFDCDRWEERWRTGAWGDGRCD
ncbi:MAG: hypothetical protein M1832_003525 [Thelocarpon impressellum]|nr:MAG: hypothetical protein M1832_003525 [Thelocarpon impressellum]